MARLKDEYDSYSEKKLKKLKLRFPLLTFRVYCILNNYGIKDVQIRQMYEISINAFNYFKGNHLKVLREVRNWKD